MPAIPVIRQQTVSSIAGLGPGPTDSGRGLAALGEAFSDIGRVNTQIKLREIEREKKNEAVENNAEVMAAHTHWLEQFQQRQQSAPPGAEGFTPQLMADFDADMAERVKKGRTQSSRQYLQDRLSQVRLGLFQDALQFEATAGAKHRENLLGEGVDKARTVAEFRPEDFDSLLDEQTVAIAASGADPQRAEELKVAAKHSLAEAAVLGMIRRNPSAALKQMNDEKSKISSINALEFPDRERLRNAAESEVRRLEAEARARQSEARGSLNEEIQDAYAARLNDIPARLPSRERFIAAYGPEDGKKRYGIASKTMQAYDIAGSVAMLPPDQGLARLESLRPKSQAGAAAKSDIYDMAVRLAGQQRARLEADPAGVLLQKDPELRTLAESSGQSAESADAYLRAMASKQDALGVQKPKLLADNHAAAIAKALQFNANAPKARTQALAELSATYGKWLPDVMAQVAPSLDGHSRVIVNMKPNDAERLDTAFANREEIGKAVPAASKTEISNQLATLSQDLASSLSDNPDAGARIAEHVEAAKLLAQDLTMRGTSPEEAASIAWRKVVGDNYNFSQQVDGAPMLRVPSTVDINAVGAGAMRAKDGIAKTRKFSVRVSPLSTPEQAQRDMAYQIKSKGYWVPNEKETGVILRMQTDTGTATPLDENGKPFELSWELLGSAAKATRGLPFTSPWSN